MCLISGLFPLVYSLSVGCCKHGLGKLKTNLEYLHFNHALYIHQLTFEMDMVLIRYEYPQFIYTLSRYKIAPNTSLIEERVIY